MALTNVQKNIASEVQKIAGELCGVKNRLTSITAMWANESMSAVTDDDLAAIAPFAHITAAEFSAAAGALAAINTTLGTAADSNWAKLLKITEGVPK